MERSRSQLAVGDVIGSHRLVRELGRGSMGTVFEAVHERIGRRSAVKVLDARLSRSGEAAARFLNEARALGRLEHPGIVEVFDCVERADGTCAIVMELLRGEALAARLHRRGHLREQAVAIGRQLAAALAAAHERGIAHRDLKPENVMLAEVGGHEQVKVLDFGLAKMEIAEGAGPGWQVETRSTTIMGTPLYMAPEQCKGAGRVGAPADVYALGVILYQMLSGAPPFNAAGAGELLAMHIYAPLPPLRERAPQVPEALCALVTAMLAKDPAARPVMRVVEQRLAAFDSASLPLPREAPLAQAGPPPRTPTLPLAAEDDGDGGLGEGAAGAEGAAWAERAEGAAWAERAEGAAWAERAEGAAWAERDSSSGGAAEALHLDLDIAPQAPTLPQMIPPPGLVAERAAPAGYGEVLALEERGRRTRPELEPPPSAAGGDKTIEDEEPPPEVRAVLEHLPEPVLAPLPGPSLTLWAERGELGEWSALEPSVPPARRRRGAALWIGAGLLGACLGAGLLAYWLQRGEPGLAARAAQAPEAQAAQAPEAQAAPAPEAQAAPKPAPEATPPGALAAQAPAPPPVAGAAPASVDEQKKGAAETTSARADEPAAAQKPEPAAAQKPEPAAAQKPEPAAAQKPEPAAAQKPEPAAAQKPEPAAAQKPEPAAARAAAPARPSATQRPARSHHRSSRSSRSALPSPEPEPAPPPIEEKKVERDEDVELVQ